MLLKDIIDVRFMDALNSFLDIQILSYFVTKMQLLSTVLSTFV